MSLHVLLLVALLSSPPVPVPGDRIDDQLGSSVGAEPIPRSEASRRSIAEARRSFAARLARFGAEHESVCAARDELGFLLYLEGDYELARPLIEEAYRLDLRRHGSESEEAAKSRENLGRILLCLGEYETALAHFERALESFERLHGPDAENVATCLDGIAAIRQARGDFDGARSLLQRALRIVESVRGHEDPLTATLVNNLALNYQESGDSFTARMLHERALAIRESALAADAPEIAESLNNLGLLLNFAGRVDAARPLLERAIEILESNFGSTHPNLAFCLANLGTLRNRQGDHEGARRDLERALTLATSAYGEEHPTTAVVLSNLAIVYHDLLDTSAAHAAYERSLRILETTVGPSHPKTSATYVNFAAFLRETEDTERAMDLAVRALRSNEATFSDQHPEVAKSLNLISALHWDAGRLGEALRLCRSAVNIAEERLGADHPTTAQLLNNLAFTLIDLGRIEEAWATVERTVSAREKHRLAVEWTLTQNERFALARTQMTAMHTQLSLSGIIGTAHAERTAYETVLWWKGQVVRSLYRSRGAALRDLAPDERERVSELVRTQAALQKELFRPVVKDRGAHGATLERLRSRAADLESELLRSLPKPRRPRVGMDELIRTLPPDTAVVDFLIHPVYRPARLDEGRVEEAGAMHDEVVTAWVIGPKDRRLHRVELGEAAAMRALVEGFLQEIGAERGVVLSEGQSLEEQLRKRLWDPLRPLLGDARRVLISPDDFLAGLPFSVLRREDGTYLLETRSFAYLQDMSTLATRSGRPTGSAAANAGESSAEIDLLCVGGIDYGGKRSPRGRRTWAELPATLDEVRRIDALHRRRFPQRTREIRTGDRAGEHRLRADMPRCRILHLATHGFANPNGLPSMWRQAHDSSGRRRMVMREEARQTIGVHPGLLSGIVLAGANHGHEATGCHDGFLTAEELSFLDMSRVELVVLSACSTGIGGMTDQGSLGVRRTLRHAGARTVVSSLWLVPDESTSRLMSRFYELMWLDGQGKLEALRNAKLDLLRQNRQEHDGDGLPVTWGAFVLDGEWQ